MKITLLLALLSLQFSQAQKLSSGIIGYVSLGANSGVAVPSNSEITVSIPLLKKVEETAFVSNISGNILTLSNSITNNAYNLNDGPFVLEISNQGVFLEISSNTNNTITLSGGGTGDTSGINIGDKLKIRRSWTIENTMGKNLPNNSFLSVYDNSGVNNSASTIYITYSGDWYNATTGALANDIPLYPSESFVYRNTSNIPVESLFIAGHLPETKARIILEKDSSLPQETRFSFLNPLQETLGESGLSSVASNNDFISTFDNNFIGINKSASKQYIFFNGDWYNATTGALANDTPLKGGEGYIYRRNDSSNTDKIIINEQNYISNL